MKVLVWYCKSKCVYCYIKYIYNKFISFNFFTSGAIDTTKRIVFKWLTRTFTALKAPESMIGL